MYEDCLKVLGISKRGSSFFFINFIDFMLYEISQVFDLLENECVKKPLSLCINIIKDAYKLNLYLPKGRNEH